MSDTGHEFTCIDCGANVVRFGELPGQPDRCAGCQWLLDTPMPDAQRAEMRADMLKRGIIGETEPC